NRCYPTAPPPKSPHLTAPEKPLSVTSGREAYELTPRDQMVTLCGLGVGCHGWRAGWNPVRWGRCIFCFWRAVPGSCNDDLRFIRRFVRLARPDQVDQREVAGERSRRRRCVGGSFCSIGPGIVAPDLSPNLAGVGGDGGQLVVGGVGVLD